jgi:hypothetical protein
MDPNMAWFTTISGSTLPNHETALGTIRYPAEPIVNPIAQKIKIASALDILHASETRSWYAIHRCATSRVLITLMVNFSRAPVILLTSTIKIEYYSENYFYNFSIIHSDINDNLELG